MLQVNLFCFIASYSVAFLLELIRLWQSRPSLRWASLAFTIAGTIAQIWYLLGRSWETQLPPLLASTHDWLLVSTLLLVSSYLIYTFSGFHRKETNSLGLFVLPLGLVMVGAASLVRNSPDRILGTERFWKMLHASSLSIGITGVLLGFLLSLMYLLQHRRLKLKQNLHFGISLPPLGSLAKYNRWMVIASFPMLTLGLITGFVLTYRARAASVEFAWADPIVIGFCVLWLAMVGLYIGLIRSKPTHGRDVAWLTVWSCGFLIVTLVGLQVLVSVMGLPSQHGQMRQWLPRKILLASYQPTATPTATPTAMNQRWDQVSFSRKAGLP